ncbi:winged helix-turn-helix domain-containing protein [Klebsiella oxytoca]|uniref:winged helix-turn-helix domain-containing protein n=1 Tax=Klebsiella oxytoca TaxID=571 RepID=UPI00387A7A5B
MVYLINSWIEFDPIGRQLTSHKEDENSILLSNQAARLLMEFIKNGNETLSKSVLLKSVWSDFGMTPSRNNLYTGLSELRKAFASLGENDIAIRTIPKIGFQFMLPVNIIELQVDNQYINNEKSEKIERKIGFPKLHYIFSTFSLFLIYFVVFYEPETISFENYNPQQLTTIDKCRIFTLMPGSEILNVQVLDFISQQQEIIKNCKITSLDIFYGNSGRLSNYNFIASCAVDEKLKHSNCLNYRILM